MTRTDEIRNVAIIGHSGEGKTTLALRLASACSMGKAFHVRLVYNFIGEVDSP